jgi:hypothetical protein
VAVPDLPLILIDAFIRKDLDSAGIDLGRCDVLTAETARTKSNLLLPLRLDHRFFTFFGFRFRVDGSPAGAKRPRYIRRKQNVWTGQVRLPIDD